MFLYGIMSSAYNDDFTSSLPIWIPCISFPYLIAMARTSTTVLNRNGENGHPCLVPDFSGKSFSFSPLLCWLWEQAGASERDLERKGREVQVEPTLMVCMPRAKPLPGTLYMLSHPDFIINPHSG